MLPGTPEFAEALARFTATVNRIAANGGSNAYELRNEALQEMEKERVRYENGRTIEGCAAERLFEDAKRASANHRRALARNLNAESGEERPENVCAHHVVASKDDRAKESRAVIFKWGIGINDADNGVYLPRFKNIPVPDLPNAPLHGPIHTDRYYTAVAARLTFGAPSDTPSCRLILQTVEKQLVAGSFPWRQK